MVKFLNWFRNFIKDFSSKISLITELTKKNIYFKWIQKQSDVINSLLNEIRNANKLYYPEITKLYEFLIDACDIGIGAILKQGIKIFLFLVND